MVSQKSMLPRGARSDFLGKENVSLPSSTYYFQQRRSLYSAQDKLWAWRIDRTETVWQPSTRTQVQTGPSKSELEVKQPYFKTSTKWELPLHPSRLFIHICDLGKQEKRFSTSDRQRDLNVAFQLPDSRGLGSSKMHRPQGDGRPKFKLWPVSQAHPVTEPPHLHNKTEKSLTELWGFLELNCMKLHGNLYSTTLSCYFHAHHLWLSKHTGQFSLEQGSKGGPSQLVFKCQLRA